MPDHPFANTSPTRAAILQAFATLALERRYDAIRIADLIERAEIGRSTFYEHFSGKSDLLIAALEPILLALATAASGRAARLYVRQTVDHLWEQRSIGRSLLSSSTAPLVQRRLAARIYPNVEQTGDATPAITATGIAAAQLAMLKSWLSGEASATIDEMTDRLIACALPIVRR